MSIFRPRMLFLGLFLLFSPFSLNAQGSSNTHDCNIVCQTTHWTPLVCFQEMHDYHTAEYDTPSAIARDSFCANYTDGSGIEDPITGDDYISGVGHCNYKWPNGALTRLLCSEIGGGFTSCSVSGMIRCPQPNGSSALVGYSLGCTASNGRIPFAVATSEDADCRAMGEGGTMVACGPDGQAQYLNLSNSINWIAK